MSALFAVQSGRKKQPLNLILAGTQGIGKSTFASDAPEPLFIGAEETGELDVARLPQVTSWKDFCAQIDWLRANKDTPKYQTLVIDTLDSIEKLLHEHLLATDPKGAKALMAAHGGYGKAYEMAEHELIELRSKLKYLRDELGKNIILLCHTKKVQATDTIIGLQYDTYELSLHNKAQAVFVDWVSAVLFANYVVHPQSGTNTDRTFAMGDGERVLLTEKRPGHIGKNRFNLPYEMPLNFKSFQKAIDAFYDNDGPTAEHVLLTIEGLCENVADDLKPKIKREVDKAAGNVAKLKKIEQRLREVIQ